MKENILQTIITCIFMGITIYVLITILNISIDRSIQRQDLRLCLDAKISNNEFYKNKCECYYQSSDITCLEANFELNNN